MEDSPRAQGSMPNGGLLALARIAVAPLVAAGFLTIVPIPLPSKLAIGPMGWPVASFPLVGAILGGVTALLGVLLGFWFPPSVVAALQVATLLGLTGALHLDGLMDSFDGLGGKDRPARLAIMKDSRVGSYGLAAAVSVLLVEYATLASIPMAERGWSLVLAGTLSRWAMVVLMWAFPAAGSRGLAAGIKPHLRWYHPLIATLIAVAIAMGAFGLTGGAITLAAGLMILLSGRFVVASLGGITGDSCGGLGQMVEALTLLLCLAVL